MEPVVADTDEREAARAEVLAGLRLPHKRIASKYHYDERGSELFEAITRLDEYYLTRTEVALRERVPWRLSPLVESIGSAAGRPART